MKFETLYQRLNLLAGQENGGDFETLAKLYINGVYRRVLSVSKTSYEEREYQLTTESGVSKYGLPLGVRRLSNIDPPNGTRSCRIITARDYDLMHPGSLDTGDPETAYPFGTFGIQKQPAAAGVISLVSSSAADAGTSFPVYIVGSDANGTLIREAVNMNGMTEVSTTASFTTLKTVVKDPANANFSGTITVTDASANVLARIPVWWMSPEYLWLEFYPIPDSALTYTLRAEERKPDLVYPEDWPEIPSEYHELLLYGAAMDLLPKVGLETVADRARDTFNKMFDDYKDSQGEEMSSGRVMTFANVWSDGRGRQRPGRPLIDGVDF